jgi:hypothetical protein
MGKRQIAAGEPRYDKCSPLLSVTSAELSGYGGRNMKPRSTYRMRQRDALNQAAGSASCNNSLNSRYLTAYEEA